MLRKGPIIPVQIKYYDSIKTVNLILSSLNLQFRVFNH